MARIRTIKPEFFMSEDIGALTPLSRLLFVALWCHADRGGKIKFQRTALAAQCMPYDLDKFDQCLAELSDMAHVVMYEVGGKRYLFLPTFQQHQRPHNTERESGLPDFNGELTVKQPLRERESPTGKGKGKGKGKEVLGQNEFDRWWAEYPRKVKKGEAKRVWSQKDLGSKTDDLIADVKNRLAHDRDWVEGYIPHPTTYLRGERWTDEITPAKAAKRETVEQKARRLNLQPKPGESRFDWENRVRSA